MTSANTSSVTAVLLAGGRGSRLGGQDKGLLLFKGQPLFFHLLEKLSSQADEAIINANRHQDTYAESGKTVFSDDLEDFQGPLAGILTALTRIHTNWLITLPCDGPYLPDDYVQRMLQSALKSGTRIAVARDSSRQQPVYLLLHRSLIDSLRSYLAEGQRKIDRWYSGLDAVEVDFSDCPNMFANANTMDDLDTLKLELP
ncbi:MAG: molybdenum cofactor guanylyltransferase MobA [Pseudomonadota bacterium]